MTAAARRAAEELTQLTEEMGLYDSARRIVSTPRSQGGQVTDWRTVEWIQPAWPAEPEENDGE